MTKTCRIAGCDQRLVAIRVRKHGIRIALYWSLFGMAVGRASGDIRVNGSLDD